MATDTLDTVAPGDTPNREIHEQLGRKYSAGFITDIESDSLPAGLDEDTIRALSAKKEEPEWMTQWRLDAYRHFLTMPMPNWAKLQIAPIDLQALSYYSAPKAKYASLDEVPQGADEHGNVEYRRHGAPPEASGGRLFGMNGPKEHYELGEALGIHDPLPHREERRLSDAAARGGQHHANHIASLLHPSGRSQLGQGISPQPRLQHQRLYPSCR